MSMDQADRKLQTFKMAYIVLAVLVALLGLAIHFMFHEDLIALGLVVLASIIILVGSWLWADQFRKRKLKGF
jgi:multisubunit Na+/H+ antiporter MnhG subunit